MGTQKFSSSGLPERSAPHDSSQVDLGKASASGPDEQVRGGNGQAEVDLTKGLTLQEVIVLVNGGAYND